MSLPEIQLTYSESKQFLRCRRQWFLGTYKGLHSRGPDRPMSAFSIGNGYHDALAAYYEHGTDPVAFTERRIMEMAAEVGEAPDEYFAKDLAKEKKLLVAMTSGYVEWLEETGADADLDIEGAERMVDVELVPGIRLLSKLDAPVRRRSDGTRLALEHKTTASLEQPQNLLKVDRQFLTEHLARFLAMQAQGATADESYQACTAILWNGAKKVLRTASAKPPFYERTDVPHNIVELRNHWRHMVAVGREIQRARAALDAGADHHVICPPNPTRDSTWDDPFFRITVMLDDGSDWEGAVDEMYEVRNPLERYEGAERLDVNPSGAPAVAATL